MENIESLGRSKKGGKKSKQNLFKKPLVFIFTCLKYPILAVEDKKLF
jgi:hypothetical protein